MVRRTTWLRGPRLTDDELARRGLHLGAALRRRDELWPGQVAIAAAVLLYFVLPPKLTPGPGRLLVIVEAGLLVALVIASRTHGKTMGRTKEVVFGFLALVTGTNLVALGLLIHYLLAGGHARGTDLVGGGVVIWTTNLLVFAVWFWELDRGGPQPLDEQEGTPMPDLLFPQMTDDAKVYAPHGWKPRFGDYLYVSLTNQAAFSPTDTMPLTLRAKILMGVQGVASLVTIGVIIARAVNVLGS